MSNTALNQAFRSDNDTNCFENPFLTTGMKELYLKTKIADVRFVFRDYNQTERISAHKTLLALKSDVFEAMFHGEHKVNGDITIIDASANAFKEFLQFFYLDRIKLTMANISDVVNLCKEYKVDQFLNICEQFLINSLTIDNVCFVYGLAILFNLDELRLMCKSLIADNTEAVFQSKSFLECHRSVLGHILNSNIISCAEVKVFDACMAWIKMASKQEEVNQQLVRQHLGELFYEIRFGSMTIQEFAALTLSYGQIFTLDEYQDIVQQIALKEFQPKIFKKNSRLFKDSGLSFDSTSYTPQTISFSSLSISSDELRNPIGRL